MYSVVIPCYNSAKTIEKVVELTSAELDRLGKTEYEFILVNDCSPDIAEEETTIEKLKELSEKYSFVTVVDLGKNAGQHNASLAGFHYAAGDVIISMDDDMQTHPSQLSKLFARLEEGYDIVYGYYESKKHSRFRNFGSWINYITVRKLIGKPKELKTSSFFMIRKYIRDSVIQYSCPGVHLQALFLRTTGNISCVPVEHFQREVGTSNYTMKKLVGLWSNLLYYSRVPIQMALVTGVLFLILGFVGILACIVGYLASKPCSGWLILLAGNVFLTGSVLFFLGIIGEYVGRSLAALSKEPQYVVKAIYKNGSIHREETGK